MHRCTLLLCSPPSGSPSLPPWLIKYNHLAPLSPCVTPAMMVCRQFAFLNPIAGQSQMFVGSLGKVYIIDKSGKFMRRCGGCRMRRAVTPLHPPGPIASNQMLHFPLPATPNRRNENSKENINDKFPEPFDTHTSTPVPARFTRLDTLTLWLSQGGTFVCVVSVLGSLPVIFLLPCTILTPYILHSIKHM
jgi:hypothetical protein